MEESIVSLKATVNGLILCLREEDDFRDIVEHLGKKLETSGKFFKGANVSVKYRGRELTPDQESEIKKLMEEKTGAEINTFEADDSVTEVNSVETGRKSVQDKLKIKKFLYFNGIEEGDTKFYKGTVRSGNLIKYHGNVVIIGDVNPGGEVVAGGNIVVMGALRGTVHAGADGNKEAFVAALNLQPTQLRIADVITRSPDEKEVRTSFIPEIATVKENMVYIEKFLPQFK